MRHQIVTKFYWFVQINLNVVLFLFPCCQRTRFGNSLFLPCPFHLIYQLPQTIRTTFHHSRVHSVHVFISLKPASTFQLVMNEEVIGSIFPTLVAQVDSEISVICSWFPLPVAALPTCPFQPSSFLRWNSGTPQFRKLPQAFLLPSWFRYVLLSSHNISAHLYYYHSHFIINVSVGSCITHKTAPLQGVTMLYSVQLPHTAD